ncbi:hypothetical protein ACPXAU_24520, partial [Salmonella enterica]|uniref:hypothetical protein n=1 Tax=Salmonella enterica TaxID=28901 RepID=UPI003CE6B49E
AGRGHCGLHTQHHRLELRVVHGLRGRADAREGGVHHLAGLLLRGGSPRQHRLLLLLHHRAQGGTITGHRGDTVGRD